MLLLCRLKRDTYPDFSVLHPYEQVRRSSPMLTVQDILPPKKIRVTKNQGSLEPEATVPASSSEVASKKQPQKIQPGR